MFVNPSILIGLSFGLNFIWSPIMKAVLKHLKCIVLQRICKNNLLKNDTKWGYKTLSRQGANKCNQMMPILVLFSYHFLFHFPPVCYFLCFTFALFALKCDHQNSLWFGANQQCIESQRFWERQTLRLAKEMEIGGEERDSTALGSFGGNCDFCALAGCLLPCLYLHLDWKMWHALNFRTHTCAIP